MSAHLFLAYWINLSHTVFACLALYKSGVVQKTIRSTGKSMLAEEAHKYIEKKCMVMAREEVCTDELEGLLVVASTLLF